MARVVKTFSDRKSGKLYRAGDEYEGGEARIAELAEKGFVAKPRKPRGKKREAAEE